jgi:hypothetical protein
LLSINFNHSSELFLPDNRGFEVDLFLRGVSQRLVDLTGFPQTVQKDGELAGNGSHGSFLRILAASSRQLFAPTPQIGIGAKGSHDVVGAAHEQATEKTVACLGDS